MLAAAVKTYTFCPLATNSLHLLFHFVVLLLNLLAQLSISLRQQQRLLLDTHALQHKFYIV